jgi:hypothetical protein
MLFSFILALCVCVPCLLITLLVQAYKKRKLVLEQNLQQAEANLNQAEADYFLYLDSSRGKSENFIHSHYMLENIKIARRDIKIIKKSLSFNNNINNFDSSENIYNEFDLDLKNDIIRSDSSKDSFDLGIKNDIF